MANLKNAEILKERIRKDRKINTTNPRFDVEWDENEKFLTKPKKGFNMSVAYVGNDSVLGSKTPRCIEGYCRSFTNQLSGNKINWFEKRKKYGNDYHQSFGTIEFLKLHPLVADYLCFSTDDPSISVNEACKAIDKACAIKVKKDKDPTTEQLDTIWSHLNLSI